MSKRCSLTSMNEQETVNFSMGPSGHIKIFLIRDLQEIIFIYEIKLEINNIQFLNLTELSKLSFNMQPVLSINSIHLPYKLEI